MAVADRVRVAFRSALEAHERAALVHERGAALYERAGRPAAGGREHAKADLERARASAAADAHPDWL